MKLDELALAMNATFERLPDEPRLSGSPHPVIKELATEIVKRSREFDGLCDELEEAWTLTGEEQQERLAVLHVAHGAAGEDVLLAEKDFERCMDDVKEVLDNMYEAQRHIIPRTAVLSNRAIRPALEILRAKLQAMAEAHHWPPGADGRIVVPPHLHLAPLPPKGTPARPRF